MGRKPKRSAWGSVIPYKSGVWQLRYPLPPDPITGKRRQGFEVVRGTKTEANKRLAQLQLTYNENRNTKALTVSKCWDTFYRPYIDRLAPSTVAGYESSYNTHIKPVFGRMTMSDIKKAQVQEWLDSMTYGAAKAAFSTLRAMYNFANDNDLVECSLMGKRYKLPEKPKHTADKQAEQVLDEAGIYKILTLAKGEPWEGAYILSAYGGARRSEAFGAKWENVHFRDGYILVSLYEGVQYVQNDVKVLPLKTDGSYRDIVIRGAGATRLHELFLDHLGDTWISEMDDNPLNPDLASAAFKRLCLNNMVRYVPWKNLRNSYATILHSKGVELGLIAKLLGHTTPIMTYKHYDKINGDRLADALKRVDPLS